MSTLLTGRPDDYPKDEVKADATNEQESVASLLCVCTTSFELRTLAFCVKLYSIHCRADPLPASFIKL